MRTTTDGVGATVDIAQVVPLAGFAFVEMEGAYRESAGPIVIPTKYRGRKSHVGRVKAIVYKPDQSRQWHGIDITGKRCVVAGHSAIPLDAAKWPAMYRVPVADIVAAVEDHVELAVDHDAPARCIHCGAAGSGSSNTMLLDHLGYCPRCGKNRDGETRDTTPKVTDEEVARFHCAMGLD